MCWFGKNEKNKNGISLRNVFLYYKHRSASAKFESTLYLIGHHFADLHKSFQIYLRHDSFIHKFLQEMLIR